MRSGSRLVFQVAGVLLVLVAVLGLVACNSGRSAPPPPSIAAPAPQPAPAPTYSPQPYASTPAPAPAMTAVDAQIQRGAGVYAASCARCHGASGEGGRAAPALIGPGTLAQMPPAGRTVRTGQFRTAMDLGMFIKTQMPPGGPHLPPDQVAAVMAYVLNSNGIRFSQVLNPSTAGSVPLNR